MMTERRRNRAGRATGAQSRESHDGRSSTVVNNKMIDAVRRMIETDRHIIYQEIRTGDNVGDRMMMEVDFAQPSSDSMLGCENGMGRGARGAGRRTFAACAPPRLSGNYHIRWRRRAPRRRPTSVPFRTRLDSRPGISGRKRSVVVPRSGS
ncbi:hypothetical protein EVAR_27761_1 [Eumeta japonica]|uniref:Uncharacterized protein n=1 Tax=Eumeta variegata TaxID=151549 RepID=A0A4C1VAK3_EUMVA|nr:hypothetical protein EVAR_27761_1 [Eumeta japonica]